MKKYVIVVAICIFILSSLYVYFRNRTTEDFTKQIDEPTVMKSPAPQPYQATYNLDEMQK